MYLLNQGEKFTPKEKEKLFFDVTKLLHSADIFLRRLIFLFVKHLDFWENSFFLTGSLIAEINKSEQMLKPTCIRLIGKIIDVSSVSSVERYLKIEISSKVPEISSSAIVCTLYMAHKGFNVAKAWISEITEKLTSSLAQSNLLTFHTLLLLKEIKDNDRLFLLKTYLNMAQSNVKSQFATCQLIRYIVEAIKKGDIEDKTMAGFTSYLEACLIKNQMDAVILEASRGILELPKVKDNLVGLALETLRNLLSNTKRVIKYAVLKTLDRAAMKFSTKLPSDIYLDLEKIIDDQSNNSSMKATALSIFLKISKGLNDNRLEKMFITCVEQYPSFKEEFKKEVVIISKSISRENPAKYKLYYQFFCKLLKLEASANTKMEILDSIIWFIYNDKDLKKTAVLFLAEYIEDCQYDNLKMLILSILGKEVSSCSSPSQLVRYIYNRIILENPMVRASAISALGEIAYKDESLRQNILSLMKRSLKDTDNEVRERSYFYIKALQEIEKKDKMSHVVQYIFTNERKIDIDMVQHLLKVQKEILLNSDNIGQELSLALKDPERMSKIMMSMTKNKTTVDSSKPKETKIKPQTGMSTMTASSLTENAVEPGDEYGKTVFAKIYGAPKIISKQIKLTDPTAEYYTIYKKIIHDNILILDFEITNTIELQVIKSVTIDISNISSVNGFDLSKSEIIEIDKLDFNEKKHLFFKMTKNDNEIYPECSFNITLKFDLQELDVKGNPHGTPLREQYKIDKKVEITYADYFMPNLKVTINNFEDFWKRAENSNCATYEEKIQLPYTNIKTAGKSFSNIIGFEPLNEVDKVDPTAKKYEFIYAMMSFYESVVFVRFQVIFNQKNECLAKVIIKSQENEIAEMMLKKILG